MQERFPESLLELPGRGIAEVKHFTQPCGVTDKDRC